MRALDGYVIDDRPRATCEVCQQVRFRLYDYRVCVDCDKRRREWQREREVNAKHQGALM